MSTGIRRPVRARRALASQRPGPLTGGSAGLADRPQRPRRIRGQRADQPGDHRIRSHRPGQLRLGAQHRDISQAVPAQPQRHGQVGNDLPGSCTARGARHRVKAPDRPWPRPVTWSASASSNPPACDTSPFPSADTVILERRPVFLHLESAFGLAWTGSSDKSLSSQAKGTFICKRSRSAGHWRKPEANGRTRGWRAAARCLTCHRPSRPARRLGGCRW